MMVYIIILTLLIINVYFSSKTLSYIEYFISDFSLILFRDRSNRIKVVVECILYW